MFLNDPHQIYRPRSRAAHFSLGDQLFDGARSKGHPASAHNDHSRSKRSHNNRAWTSIRAFNHNLDVLAHAKSALFGLSTLGQRIQLIGPVTRTLAKKRQAIAVSVPVRHARDLIKEL